MPDSEQSHAFDVQVRNRSEHPICGPCEIDCESGEACPMVADEDDLNELSNNPLRRQWMEAAIAIVLLAAAVGGFMWAYLA